MALLEVGKKYQIIKGNGMHQLPYAGEIGKLVDIEETEVRIMFPEETRRKCKEGSPVYFYRLGDFVIAEE